MIGYYIHHVGQGHLERADCISQRLRTPVTGLSSAECPAGWPGDWIQLDRDDYGDCRDVTANGTFHWAPCDHGGLRTRMRQIADWIAGRHPQVIVSDVSVEVAAFSRLMGVPTVVVALPGERDDEPHMTGYRLASAIIAPWPARFTPSGWSRRWDAKTHYVGAFSGFDGRPRSAAAALGAASGGRARDGSNVTSGATPRRVLAMFGTGGMDIEEEQLCAVADFTSDYAWDFAGAGGRWLRDPWAELCRADIVVTHAGNGCVAAVAAAARPAVVIPQRRPFNEQTATARVLHDAGLARVEWSWPKPKEWDGVLEAAYKLGGQHWSEWCPGDGASRAARVIESVAAASRL